MGTGPLCYEGENDLITTDVIKMIKKYEGSGKNKGVILWQWSPCFKRQKKRKKKRWWWALVLTHLIKSILL